MDVGGVPGSIIIHSSLGTIHDDVIPSDKSFTFTTGKIIVKTLFFSPCIVR